MYQLPARTRKSIIVFAVVIGAYLLYVAINLYMHRVDIEQYRAYRKAMHEYTELYTHDEFGGASPAETLTLFRQALEKNDALLAAKYILADTVEARERWLSAMTSAQRAGKFPELVRLLAKAQPEPDGIIGEKFYAFGARDASGVAELTVSLVYNGRIWKINSL